MQPPVDTITLRVDSDHAGCIRTRRSTSGLAAFHGRHLIKAASTTQTVIAMSSGESEFYAIVRGVATALARDELATWSRKGASRRDAVALDSGSVPPEGGDDSKDPRGDERGGPEEEVLGRSEYHQRDEEDGLPVLKRSQRPCAEGGLGYWLKWLGSRGLGYPVSNEAVGSVRFASRPCRGGMLRFRPQKGILHVRSHLVSSTACRPSA